MAVPKKKKSISRSKMRRGSNGTLDPKFLNAVEDKNGDLTLPHHISPEGYYKGRQVIKKKVKAETQPE